MREFYVLPHGVFESPAAHAKRMKRQADRLFVSFVALSIFATAFIVFVARAYGIQ